MICYIFRIPVGKTHNFAKGHNLVKGEMTPSKTLPREVQLLSRPIVNEQQRQEIFGETLSSCMGFSWRDSTIDLIPLFPAGRVAKVVRAVVKRDVFGDLLPRDL